MYRHGDLSGRGNAYFTIVIQNGEASASLDSDGRVQENCYTADSRHRANAESITITSITVE